MKIKISENLIKSISTEIDNAKNIVITGHTNPDGDAVGASLALYHVLKKSIANVRVIMPNGIPRFLRWLPNCEEIIFYEHNEEECSDLIKNADIIFSLDYNELSRLEEMGENLKNSKAKKIIIDHHPSPSNFADYIISDTSVSSASELIFEFIYMINKESHIDINVAESIFTGILTDTGAFSFNSSEHRTFEIVGELLKYGINKNEIISNVYSNFSEDRMRLQGFVLSKKMKVFHEHSSAYISLTKDDISNFKFAMADTDGFVNLPLSIKGIKFTVFFFEKTKYIKLSLRSRGDFDVNKFARKHFNGGGHKNAAGGKSYMTMEETIEKFVSLLPDM